MNCAIPEVFQIFIKGSHLVYGTPAALAACFSSSNTGVSQRMCRETATKGVDISRHFSMYAFDGGTGHLRWKHEGEDFHKDAAELQDRTVPQHNHRLDAEHLGGRHYGEDSCRDFRESVLAAMPHRYDVHLRKWVSHKPLDVSSRRVFCNLWCGCQLPVSTPSKICHNPTVEHDYTE